jgi:hypothetical protein
VRCIRCSIVSSWTSLSATGEHRCRAQTAVIRGDWTTHGRTKVLRFDREQAIEHIYAKSGTYALDTHTAAIHTSTSSATKRGVNDEQQRRAKLRIRITTALFSLRIDSPRSCLSCASSPLLCCVVFRRSSDLRNFAHCSVFPEGFKVPQVRG